MAGLADAWKYVIQADCIAPDGLPTSALGMRVPPGRPTNKGQVYVQPADQKDDELNRKNTEAAVASCIEHGYRLCLQLHKIVGLA